MKEMVKTIRLSVLCLILLSACNRDIENLISREDETGNPISKEPLTFDVSIEGGGATFKVGDTVQFNLIGTADLICFYSGSIGNSYTYHDKDRFYEVTPTLKFQSAKSAGNNPDCARLYYSTEFDGNYTYENIKSTTWLDITDRFHIAPLPPTTGLVNTPSGEVEIKDIFESGKPVYFAWHCTTQAGSQRTQFRVQEFTITGYVKDNPTFSSILYNQAGMDFQWYQNEASATQGSNLPSVSSTQLLWNGIFNNLTGPFKEGYAVSKPVVLPELNAGTDKPLLIIAKQSEPSSSNKYKYVYNQEGEYEAVFIASQVNSANDEIIKKLFIKIEN